MEMMRQWTACIAKTHLTEGWQTEETGELLAAANNVCLCVCVCVCACVCERGREDMIIEVVKSK